MSDRSTVQDALGSDRSHGDLVRRASEGDQRAWHSLVTRFDPVVRRTARRAGLDASDAADVAQVTWLRLLQHVGHIREPECLPGWLVTTARRESVRMATARSQQVVSADPVAEHGDGHVPAVCDAYPVEGGYEPTTEAALRRLPDRYEALLRLLTSECQPSYTEIAERTGLPIGSIGPMRMRGLRLLRHDPDLAAARAAS